MNTPFEGELDAVVGPDVEMLCPCPGTPWLAPVLFRSPPRPFNSVMNPTIAVITAANPVRMPGSVVQNVQNPPRRAACEPGVGSEPDMLTVLGSRGRRQGPGVVSPCPFHEAGMRGRRGRGRGRQDPVLVAMLLPNAIPLAWNCPCLPHPHGSGDTPASGSPWPAAAPDHRPPPPHSDGHAGSGRSNGAGPGSSRSSTTSTLAQQQRDQSQRHAPIIMVRWYGWRTRSSAPTTDFRPASQIGQGAAVLNVLLHEIGLAVVLAVVVDLDDVGMLQCGDRAGLALEADNKTRIAREGEHLDGDQALQGGLVGLVHGGHAALADDPAELVAAKPTTSQVAHGACSIAPPPKRPSKHPRAAVGVSFAGRSSADDRRYRSWSRFGLVLQPQFASGSVSAS